MYDLPLVWPFGNRSANYRTSDELENWKKKDPVAKAEKVLIELAF